MTGTATTNRGFERRIGPWQATAINMTQMCGIGPFVTIPTMVAVMGGPQAVLGWLVGALLAVADGLVWAELGAALPGAGGSYVYLREAFQHRTGRLMPFLFAWTAMLFIPLIMATGVIGLVSYLGYLVPGLLPWQGRVIGVGVVALAVLLLYRRIGEVTRLTTALFAVMLVSVLSVVVAAYTHFDADLAFTFPDGAFAAGGPFWTGLGAGLVIAVYDYLGYNTAAYLGAEVRDPGRTLPRAVLFSILGIMALYLLLNLGVLGVVPWQEVASSTSVASLVLERSWGGAAARVFTVCIVVTAFGSVFAGLLGGSRVPFHAARDGLFLPWFGRLHPRLRFPHVALVAMGAVTAVGSLFTLQDVINMLTAAFVIVQSIAQVVALVVLRCRRPDLPRPYRQWLYPLPCVVALVGWAFVYYSAGLRPVLLSLGWLVVGTLAFLLWARRQRTWPFGPLPA
ncbi:Amino acid transporter [Streptoalloteichus tenebrarius]|uniref:Amino acid transporter n=1 Tax=Streptoalloteichus tenebrarius (strain ATCC 17920 / DSM 40477 / JCM 4838 / CBS 697.72 / NBRC 16177 / NCIMB 11028 / NRRL B-12390 / A12253. 1 / ISP 5477) TaxID=1933 RepID=A0ABT1HXM9_STRSD|nr:APC family permease [Streptoalloteichus tenebrarius]MCP2260273.1 Amino acid transporter [Streptoalloteichus tenebrarius]BFF03023.1 APC family permease [Streptoalloteichus tenebrarius]